MLWFEEQKRSSAIDLKNSVRKGRPELINPLCGMNLVQMFQAGGNPKYLPCACLISNNFINHFFEISPFLAKIKTTKYYLSFFSFSPHSKSVKILLTRLFIKNNQLKTTAIKFKLHLHAVLNGISFFYR